VGMADLLTVSDPDDDFDDRYITLSKYASMV